MTSQEQEVPPPEEPRSEVAGADETERAGRVPPGCGAEDEYTTIPDPPRRSRRPRAPRSEYRSLLGPLQARRYPRRAERCAYAQMV
jgi:hypothetical protein